MTQMKELRKRSPRRMKHINVALLLVFLALLSGMAIPFSGVLDLVLSPMPTCTLADQIIASNMRKAVRGCPAGTGNDVITLHGSLTLNRSLPRITSTITIEGKGHTIDGDGKYQIFDVMGGVLHINDLIMTRGKAYEGGAIELGDGAELLLKRSTISDSSGTYGGAIHSVESWIKVVDSSFINNSAVEEGGAIFDKGDLHTLEIKDSTFIGNSSANGGGFYKLWSSVHIENSTFKNNTADNGGGFYAKYADVRVRDTRLENNTAREGNAVYRLGGTMELHDSIIVGKGSGPHVYRSDDKR